MILTSENVRVTLFRGKQCREATLTRGQGFRLTYLNAEPIILVVGGEWDGWYFAPLNPNDPWIGENTVSTAGIWVS